MGVPLGVAWLWASRQGEGELSAWEVGAPSVQSCYFTPLRGTVSAFYANGCKQDRPVGLSLGRRLSSMRATQWVAPTFGVRDIASGCPLGIRTRIKHERYGMAVV